MCLLTCGHIQHMYSWWWVGLSPETCRVKHLRRINRNYCISLELFHYKCNVKGQTHWKSKKVCNTKTELPMRKASAAVYTVSCLWKSWPRTALVVHSGRFVTGTVWLQGSRLFLVTCCLVCWSALHSGHLLYILSSHIRVPVVALYLERQAWTEWLINSLITVCTILLYLT